MCDYVADLTVYETVQFMASILHCCNIAH